MAAGDVTFTPDDNLCGTGAASFDYTVDDGNDGTDTGHVVIDLTCVNDNPSAGNDTVTVAEDSADNDVTEDILANDTDVDGDTVHVSDVSNATGGSVDLAAGVVTFTPTADGCGNGYGSFDYEVSDGNGGTANGHAEVNVTCVDDAPVATDDAKTGTEDTDVVLTGAFLTGNDTDIDTDQGDLTVTTIANLVGGTAAVNDGDVDVPPDRQPVRRRRGQLRLHGRRRQRRHRRRSRGHRPHVRQRRPHGRGRQRHGRRELGGGGLRRPRQRHRRRGRHAHAGVRRHGHRLERPVAGTASKHGNKVQFTPAQNFQGQAHITYTLTDGEDTAQATLTVTVGPDVDAPVVAKPTVVFGSGRVDETAPLRISWSAVDAGVGVASYDVQVSVAGGAFKPVYSGPKTSVTALYPFRKSLVWRVRATDHEGNVSGWVNSAKRSIASIQNSNHNIHYRGPWTGVRMPAASGQGFSYGSSTSSRAAVTFNGRGILYVAPRNKASGYVKVYVDGALIGRYKLANAKFLNGRIITRFAWSANGHHRIRIVNDKNGKRANLDAFIVLK